MRKQTRWLCAALIIFFATSVAMAQEFTSRQAVLQNEEFRQDFIVQGEYLFDRNDGYKIGMHLIANGGGSFRVTAYQGGLPGDGWSRGGVRMQGTARVDGDRILFNFTEISGTNPAGETPPFPESMRRELVGNIIIERPQGGGQGGRAPQTAGQFFGANFAVRIENIENARAVYVKQFRQSPTLGAEPPEGAIVIFDGTNLDWFRQGAQMNEQQRGGNTLFGGAATRAFEKRPYRMHIEFMLPLMPQARGQQRGNSGVYIDERYELQVLDSFGQEAKDDYCGGFYQLATPLLNMTFPPLTWQTYCIYFTPARWDGDAKIANARVTVYHNGVLIHDDIELARHTPGRRDEGPEPLGLFLQRHTGTVQFRNIWLQYQDWAEPVAQTEATLERPTRRAARSGITVQQPVSAVITVTEAMLEPVVVMVEEVAPQRRRAATQSRPLFPRLRALFQ